MVEDILKRFSEVTNVLKRDKICRDVIGDSILTMEEMYTLLMQIETCLNSRPLTLLSYDPMDLQALTSGHFLIRAPLDSVLEADLTSIPPSHLSC
ncbi:hypothetical protein ILUMI_23761 [Ignelater luminosus]|uniref:Uncharacterized protein n=1 Tax=Ignelater luminosus TaxID=2038154 RepID=A0A8K0G1A4_IGNLU|nr:hypothetical protein ILUMI_23761 [Ignelater luminosus]